MASELHNLTQELLNKETALKISEERYKELVESINDIIFTSDLDGNLLYISPSVNRISKYSVDDFIGQNVSKFVHNEYHDQLVSIIVNIKNEIPSKPIVLKTVDKDGSGRYIRISSKFHAQNKKIITGTIVDVTELILMQKKLELSEQKYKAIVEDQTELIFRALPDGVITFANTAFCKYFNTDFKNILAKNFLDLLPEDDQINIIETFKKLTQENPSSMIIHKAIVDGQERYIQSFYRMIFDERNNPLIVQGIGRDITNQLKMEQVLYRRCSILQSLSDTMEAMVWVKNIEGRYMFASKMLCDKIFKRDSFDVLGSVDKDLFIYYISDIKNTTDNITINENVPCRFYVIYKRQTEEIWVDVKQNVLTDMNEEDLGVISVAFDITSEKDKIIGGLNRRIENGEVEKINDYIYKLNKV